MSEPAGKLEAPSIQPDPDRNPHHYLIRVEERLSPHWSEGFEGLSATYTTSGETILSGVLQDQSALHGLLARIRDLNLTLISVSRADSNDPTEMRRSRE
jgi:hypothetical protein